jgi:hypothetical protein
MDAQVRGPVRGRGPTMFDWLMLALSFATVVWILAAH